MADGRKTHYPSLVRSADGPGWPGVAPMRVMDLTVLATTDLHGQILSYDYFANRPQFGAGLAQTASLIHAMRALARNTLLLDNGDFFQGSALTELAARSRNRRRPHPAIAAFNALHYDAVALGNHEFDYGLAALEEALGEARFPAVSANVLRMPEGDLLVKPYAILDRGFRDRTGNRVDLRVGVLGLTPPEVLAWGGERLAGRIAVRPMVEAAEEWVPRLRAAGADVVICLAHAGIARPGLPAASDEIAAEIAGIPGIDALVAGHSHLVFPPAFPEPEAGDFRYDSAEGLICGKPAVQAGHSGSHLGVIDLQLTQSDCGWRVTAGRGRVVSASEVVAGISDAEIRRNARPLRQAIAADHRAALSWTRRRLGQTLVPLATHFATVADTQAMRLVAAAKEEAVRRALADTPHAGVPVVASVTPFRAGGRGGPLNYTDIPPGPLTVRNVHDLYPFPNTLCALRVTGADLCTILERSAAMFLRILPGLRDQVLIDPTFAPFDFESIPALGYRIDLSRPPCPNWRAGQPGGRVTGLTYQGRPLVPAEPFILVTNSHRIGARPTPGLSVLRCNTACTEAIAAFIESRPEIGPLPGPGWGFAPLPGASVVYDTGIGADRHLADVATMRPVFLGLTEKGFHRFRLHL